MILVYIISGIVGILLFLTILGFLIENSKKKKPKKKKKLAVEVRQKSEKRVIKQKEQSKLVSKGEWEIVKRNSKRWFELEYGDGELFPGYGKMHDRVFETWYCDIGSKEKKDIQKHSDQRPLRYEPKYYKSITGENVYLDKLHKKGEYIELFTGVDSKNRKRWYFGLVNSSPIWIQTESAD